MNAEAKNPWTLQLARKKLEVRSIWRHLACSASPRWRALYSYVAAQFESAAHHNLILSQSFEPERNQFSVEVSAQHTLLWAFLFVSLILSLHLIISKTSNRLSSISFRIRRPIGRNIEERSMNFKRTWFVASSRIGASSRMEVIVAVLSGLELYFEPRKELQSNTVKQSKSLR